MKDNKILDEIEKEIEPPKFALKCYDQFLTSVLLYLSIIVLILFIEEIKINIPINLALLFFFVIGTIGFIFNFFGMLNYLKSRKKEEQFIWKLLVGGIGNLLLFLSWIWILFLYQMFNRSAFYFG